MLNEINIVLIPLDNRPVSYTLPKQIAEINKNIKVFLPPREVIGGLYDISNIDYILNWLKQILSENTINAVVCSLDTLAYGGLVPSRRTQDSQNTIAKRLERFKNIILNEKAKNSLNVYAFTSIMRISNNNINEEEKEYWDTYGELIFKYSELTHKQKTGINIDLDQYNSVKNKIPAAILNDYTQTRQKNFDLNVSYLSWINEDILDFLVYSQDDTAEFGLNVMESQIIQEKIHNKNLSMKVKAETGADEIPSDLITRAITELSDKKILIYPVLSTKNGSTIISRYENRTIFESIVGELSLCGAEITENQKKADIFLLVNTPETIQNDHAMQLYNEPENSDAARFCVDFIKKSGKPVILADISHANGSDNNLTRVLIKKADNLDKIYGYAGWNTTGNTLGSAISMGVSMFLAEKNNNLNLLNFKELLLIRIADDWAYQAVVRQKIRSLTDKADLDLLKNELEPFIKDLANKINLTLCKTELSFPWYRTFEVEINLHSTK